jgi:hypothetical protein
LLGVLAINSLFANWNLNAVWDLCFARVTGPIFYGARASSLLAICGMAVYLSWRWRSPSIATLALFGTASIHELSLLAVALAWWPLDGVRFDGDGISLSYFLWLLGFLLLGLKFLPSYQKRMWLIIAGVMLAWYWVAMFTPWPSTMDPRYFYNLGSNLSESVSWFLPVSLWLIPRRWLNG